MDAEQVTSLIIGAAITVHGALGPGLLESAYEHCLCSEMSARRLRFERQVAVPLRYRGVTVEIAYRLDLLVEESVIVEVKAVDRITEVHRAQLLSYLRLSDRRLGLLLNFHVKRMTDGIHRVVNGWEQPFVPSVPSS